MHEIFKAAIRANPTDHVNHLVYADWLEENGYRLMGRVHRHIANILSTYPKYAHKRGFEDESRYVYQKPEETKWYVITNKETIFVNRHILINQAERNVRWGEWIRLQ